MNDTHRLRLARHLRACSAMAGAALLPLAGPALDGADAAIYYATTSLTATTGTQVVMDFSTTPLAIAVGGYSPFVPFDFGIHTFGGKAAYISAPTAGSAYSFYFAAKTASGAEDGYQIELGETIDGSIGWELLSIYTAYYGDISEGAYWSAGDTGYVGVKIGKGGSFYYGWIGIDLDGDSYATVTGFAWESSPGTAIIAGATGVPEPSSMALTALAAGAAGLARWRRGRDASDGKASDASATDASAPDN